MGATRMANCVSKKQLNPTACVRLPPMKHEHRFAGFGGPRRSKGGLIIHTHHHIHYHVFNRSGGVDPALSSISGTSPTYGKKHAVDGSALVGLDTSPKFK